MIEIILLVSSVLFIFALKLFGRPSTAHRANTFAMLAMALAVFSAFNFDFSKYDSAFYITIVVSGLLGVLISKRVQMTQMPELVGLMALVEELPVQLPMLSSPVILYQFLMFS